MIVGLNDPLGLQDDAVVRAFEDVGLGLNHDRRRATGTLLFFFSRKGRVSQIAKCHDDDGEDETEKFVHAVR